MEITTTRNGSEWSADNKIDVDSLKRTHKKNITNDRNSINSHLLIFNDNKAKLIMKWNKYEICKAGSIFNS